MSYYSRDHQMIYSNSKELRQADMEDVRQWILTLLNPEKQSTARAIKKGFRSRLCNRYRKDNTIMDRIYDKTIIR